MMRVFSDFEGTITLHDVGDAMFERFGGDRCRRIVREYREGRMSAVDCFRNECGACGPVNLADLDSFLDEQPIDRTFIEFVRFYRAEGLACYVVSDGMDYYIKRILDRCGAKDVPFFANVLQFIPVDGTERVRFQPRFPYRDEVCDRCACCKRNHLLTMSADDDIIVYIGEGYSDRCPARYADIVFAKDDLLRYCRDENISYYEYDNFSDIIRRLRNILAARHPDGSFAGLRKRRRAEIARRDIYLGG